MNYQSLLERFGVVDYGDGKPKAEGRTAGDAATEAGGARTGAPGW
ncbi:MAG: hypothetical protein R3B90_10475 [Planctomycetaceae bacterium]